MKRQAECWRCAKVRQIQYRGMCNPCSATLRHKIRRGDPDAQYELWLLGPADRQVPHILAAEIVREAERLAGGPKELARHIGIEARVLRRIRAGAGARVSTLLKVAEYMNCVEEVDAMFCQTGIEGWSETATYCGEDSGALDGCGSAFHEHYGDGLCQECWMREVLGVGPVEPRDVRMAVKR